MIEHIAPKMVSLNRPDLIIGSLMQSIEQIMIKHRIRQYLTGVLILLSEPVFSQTSDDPAQSEGNAATRDA